MATQPGSHKIQSVNELVAVAMRLGAAGVAGWSLEEERLAANASPVSDSCVAGVRAAILNGQDPLGDAFSALFSNDERRPKGATYTPQPIIDAMLAWAARQTVPVRVIDPGAGSARFLVAAGRLFPHTTLLAIEIDPLAALVARANIAVAGMSNRAEVRVSDFRNLALPRVTGPTLFLGNPPYVRHHLIEPHWKAWLSETAKSLGYEASQLAGLHVHFFLATALYAKLGDLGVLITAAEWLDVNYGRLVRQLLMGILGATTMHVLEPDTEPFPGTQTTAVITGFAVGAQPERIGLRRVAALQDLGQLETDWSVRRDRLATADRWSPLTRGNAQRREGFVELGELCRVHRGQVTGANKVWIQSGNDFGLPESVLYPTVTKARELFNTDGTLENGETLRYVVDLPTDLDTFDKTERRRIDTFLSFARSRGAESAFVARNRKKWWSVGLRAPAPILATYMARRPPAFVRNLAEARHINMAHGLYPRIDLTEDQLRMLGKYLSQNVTVTEGRTYAGGLTKFEPREMARLLVPAPDMLGDPLFWADQAPRATD